MSAALHDALLDLIREWRKVYAEHEEPDWGPDDSEGFEMRGYAEACAEHAATLRDLVVVPRLEELRREIQAERISYGELAELQSLADLIPEGDVELREWAGVPEYPTTESED